MQKSAGQCVHTVAAVYDGVNKLESGDSPLLASPQGGVAASLKNFAKLPKQTQPGWFSFLFPSENHPDLAISGCFAIFLKSLGHPSLR
jgi:hypothetical protein